MFVSCFFSNSDGLQPSNGLHPSSDGLNMCHFPKLAVTPIALYSRLSDLEQVRTIRSPIIEHGVHEWGSTHTYPAPFWRAFEEREVLVLATGTMRNVTPQTQSRSQSSKLKQAPRSSLQACKELD